MSPALASWLLVALSGVGADVLVVCPHEWRAPIQPWIEHRTRQGHEVALLSNQGTAEEIRGRIRQQAQDGQAKFLLLVGDAGTDAGSNTPVPSICVPTHLAAAKVNIRFGSEPQIATDNWYADLDDDGVPELAVGRLTADTSAELRTMIDKILAYETRIPAGAWRRRVSFVAGLGGFGALTDAVLEACTKRFITDGVPGCYNTTMTYANWRSPYCPHPADFKQTVIERLNEGCLFWVYIGHGQAHGLDQFAVPGGVYSILESRDLARLQCRQGAPIAFFLSCHTGAYDAPQDCLAEEMLRAPGGPVAVLCGSRMTMPYAMAVLGAEALKECFQNRRATVGEVLLYAKRSSVLGERSQEISRVLDLLAGALNAPGDLAEERREHVKLFNLIGDPLLRIPQPQSVRLRAPSEAAAGTTLAVEGTSGIDGPCLVELVVRRDRLPFTPPARQEFDSSASTRRLYGEVYRRANDTRVAAVETQCVDGVWQAVLSVPKDLRGACLVRALVQGEGDFAMGETALEVTRASESK
jgi:hypothetical protein